MAKFGIVVPVYKHWHLLDKCILSLLAQTKDLCNIYIISDEINGFKEWRNKGYMSLFPRVKLYEDFQHKGKAKRLNESFDYVTDEYWGCFDADDIMSPNALKRIQYLKESWCYGDMKTKETYYAGVFNRERLKKGNFIPQGSVFVKTEIIKKIRFNEKLTMSEDWEMWLQLAKEFEPRYINQVQYTYNTKSSVMGSNKGGLSLKRFIRKLNNRRKFR